MIVVSQLPLKVYRKVKVDPITECWLYGKEKKKHYPDLCINGGRIPLHRAIYEMFVGGIEDGHEVDHLCRRKNCINPVHLEPVTHLENMRRYHVLVALKTHCVRGHELAAVGWYESRSREGWLKRCCKACAADAQRRYLQSRHRHSPGRV
jgi:hypothetical protein